MKKYVYWEFVAVKKCTIENIRNSVLLVDYSFTCNL